MEEQKGDEPVIPFSFLTDRKLENTYSCFLTWTTPETHRIILDNVAKVVSGREKTLMAPLEEGIRGLELGNAIMLSGWLGGMVSLPIDSALYAEKLAELVGKSRYVKKDAVRLEEDDFGGSF